MPPIMANSKEGQSHMGKYLDIIRKVLSQEVVMCNIKSSSTHWLFQSFKQGYKLFLKMGQTQRSRSRSQNKKIIKTKERSYHMKYSCQISKFELFLLKSYKQYLMFQRGGQNDRMTDRTKRIPPPIFDNRDITIETDSRSLTRKLLLKIERLLIQLKKEETNINKSI